MPSLQRSATVPPARLEQWVQFVFEIFRCLLGTSAEGGPGDPPKHPAFYRILLVFVKFCAAVLFETPGIHSRCGCARPRRDPPEASCILPYILLSRRRGFKNLRNTSARKNSAAARTQSIKNSVVIWRRQEWDADPPSPKHVCLIICLAYFHKMTTRVNFQGDDCEIITAS